MFLFSPFSMHARIDIEIELGASDEEWETVYETIRREADAKEKALADKNGVEIGKRIPEKGTE